MVEGATTASANGVRLIAADKSLIVFDGVCLLCNRWLHFVLKRDRQERFCFVAMQSTLGQQLLRQNGLDALDPNSFLLLDGANPATDTTAIIRILRRLGVFWTVLAGVLWLIPKPLRNAGYRLIARNRYRWFGRHHSCPLPPAHWRERVITE